MKSLNVPHTFPIKNNQFAQNDTLNPVGINRIIGTDPMEVNTYSEMVDMVSKLAWFNRQYVLFFRGQNEEYSIGSRFPTVYPTYFRKYIQKEISFENLIYTLGTKQDELKEKNHNRNQRFHGASSVFESLHVRWALLQHYNICDTPLVDITQSLHVAASFALQKESNETVKTGIVYVFALPWPSRHYHINKEEDIYLVRLAGVTPPQAKRPYRQEAYAVMSRDVDFKQRDNLERYDLAKRMVCKFEINDSIDFWGDSFNPLSESFLVPKDDIFYKFMMNDLQPTVSDR
jgi:hypothetical protein